MVVSSGGVVVVVTVAEAVRPLAESVPSEVSVLTKCRFSNTQLVTGLN
jgi:hypothetical protein